MTKQTLALIISAIMSGSVLAGGVDIDKISSSFNELDNDDDGMISKEEADDDDIWEHFALIDGNKDGNISRDEFNAYMDNNTGLVAENSEITESGRDVDDMELEPIEHEFDEIDDDSNGYISLAEADDHVIENHFGYIDENDDNLISEAEFDGYKRDLKLEKKKSVTVTGR